MYAYATLATLGDDIYFEPSTALVVQLFRGQCTGFIQKYLALSRPMLPRLPERRPDCLWHLGLALIKLRSGRILNSHHIRSCATTVLTFTSKCFCSFYSCYWPTILQIRSWRCGISFRCSYACCNPFEQCVFCHHSFFMPLTKNRASFDFTRCERQCLA